MYVLPCLTKHAQPDGKGLIPTSQVQLSMSPLMEATWSPVYGELSNPYEIRQVRPLLVKF